MGPGILLAIAGTLAVIGGLWDYFSRQHDLEKTRGFITGGDSIVYAEHIQPTENYREIFLRLAQEGTYPVYDIEVSVHEVDEGWNEISYPNTQFARPAVKVHSLEVVSPAHTPTIFRVQSVPETDAPEVLRYKIVFATRNSYFAQYMRLQNVGEAWEQQFVLYERRDIENPRKTSGAVDGLVEAVRKSMEDDRQAVSWRLIGPSEEEIRLKKDVYKQIELACHGWKNAYMVLREGGFEYFQQFENQFGDNIWDTLRESPKPDYSVDAWRRYRPLFKGELSNVIGKLQRILSTHSGILPDSVKTLIMQTTSQLALEGTVYDWIPSDTFAHDKDVFFEGRFKEVIVRLELLSREIDRLRDEL